MRPARTKNKSTSRPNRFAKKRGERGEKLGSVPLLQRIPVRTALCKKGEERRFDNTVTKRKDHEKGKEGTKAKKKKRKLRAQTSPVMD